MKFLSTEELSKLSNEEVASYTEERHRYLRDLREQNSMMIGPKSYFSVSCTGDAIEDTRMGIEALGNAEQRLDEHYAEAKRDIAQRRSELQQELDALLAITNGGGEGYYRQYTAEPQS